MNISDLNQVFQMSIKAQTPCLARSAPGIGKTSVAWQACQSVAESMGLTPVLGLNDNFVVADEEVRPPDPAGDFVFWDIRVSQIDPVELRGIPMPKDGRTAFMLPDWLPTLGQGVIFLDELTSASKAMQTALYQLVNERRIGSWVMPSGYSILAAGNRLQDRATAQTMSTALLDRFFVVDVDADYGAWADWYDQQSDMHEAPRHFVAFRKDLLHTMESGKGQDVFATPRSWAKLGRSWSSIQTLDQSLWTEVAAGFIGAGAAVEFMAFVKSLYLIPTMEEIVAEPKTLPVPTEPSLLCATCSMIARRIDRKNLKQAWLYIKRLPMEYQVMAVKLAFDLTAKVDPKTKRRLGIATSSLMGAPGCDQVILALQSYLID